MKIKMLQLFSFKTSALALSYLRIGKLEDSMETLSSIFSSLKFKKEKAFGGKEREGAANHR
jgi:hypothetical protein